MGLTRRDLTIGLAAVAGGVGILNGTGAFSGDTANRDVRIQFESDSDAVLTMSSVDEEPEHVSVVEDADGVISLSIDEVNAKSKTVISDLVRFTNNGTQPLERIEFRVDDRSIGAVVSVQGDLEGEALDANDEQLDPGESVTGLGMTIDTRDEVTGGVEGIDIKGTIYVSTLAAPP